MAAAVLVASACAPSPATDHRPAPASGGSGSWTADRLGGLDARVYVPPGNPPPEGRGLMVVLHGCGQQASAIGDGGNWSGTADAAQWVVVAPSVPNGGVYFGCWDYYGTGHTRTNRHNGPLLALVAEALARSGYAIDPARVYVAGLSSGGGEAMVLGCLAPDVFAGVGLNAAPTVGTSAGDIGRVATTESAAVNLCRNMAGSRSGDFATQLVSIVHGDNDFTVASGYNRLNAQVFANLYGASGPTSFSLSGLPGANTAGSGARWSDGIGPRVEQITNTGIGHNWPAGSGGGGGAFVQGNSVDYPQVLADYFEAHNRRGSGDRRPSIAELSATEDQSTVVVSARVTDDGQVASVVVAISGPTSLPDRAVSLDPSGAFQLQTAAVADGRYVITVTATDDGGQISTATTELDVGGPPPPPPGVTATLTEHIQAGRLAWSDYGTYYLVYGTAPFTLYLQPDGSWSDVPPNGGTPDAGVPDTGRPDAGTPDVGSPDVGSPDSGAPDGGSPDAGAPDAGSSCTEYTASNYAHVQAGRATVCSFGYACAVGSGDNLGLYNTFVRSTLRNVAPGYFEAGTCP